MQVVGDYTRWPVMGAIGLKLCVGICESKLLSRGWSQKYLRKCAVWTASTLNWAGIFVFSTTWRPSVATIGQILVFAGLSFDSQAGFLPNTIEVCDKDIGYLGSCLNTLSWLVSFVLAMGERKYHLCHCRCIIQYAKSCRVPRQSHSWPIDDPPAAARQSDAIPHQLSAVQTRIQAAEQD